MYIHTYHTYRIYIYIHVHMYIYIHTLCIYDIIYIYIHIHCIYVYTYIFFLLACCQLVGLKATASTESLHHCSVCHSLRLRAWPAGLAVAPISKFNPNKKKRTCNPTQISEGLAQRGMKGPSHRALQKITKHNQQEMQHRQVKMKLASEKIHATSAQVK